MILAIAAEKGGAGKTTMAVNLAVWRALQGRRVLLIDADPAQASASAWMAVRMQSDVEPPIVCAMLEGKLVSSQVRAMAPLYDDVVIDGRGANDRGLLGALTVAHRCLTPCRPGQFDLLSMGNMAELVSIAREQNSNLDALAVINQALTNDGDSDAREAQGVLAESVPGYRLLPTVVHLRKAFGRCGAAGLGVMEMAPQDARAVAEMDAVAREVWA
jgi:chromosome partitioning protein